MLNKHKHRQQSQEKKRWWLSFPGFIVFILLIAIGYYLITEHRAHLFNILPLLLCPLMHLMHGGHDKHKNNHSYHRIFN